MASHVKIVADNTLNVRALIIQFWSLAERICTPEVADWMLQDHTLHSPS